MKVVVITGAGSGIGRAAALAFSKNGDQVVLAGRTEATLTETKELCANRERALVARTDVTNENDVHRLFEEVRDRFGRVDVLFNNAGSFAGKGSIADVNAGSWRSMIEVNLTGSFLCAQAAFNLMKEQSPQGGRIINNGSISAHSPRPHSVAYTAAKHAITGLTKSISLDGRPFDIACGQIDIGNAATSLTSFATGAMQADGRVVVEPFMSADAAAEAVVYMASQALEVNVQFMTISATKMPFVGRG